jgi:hypothetical protein
MAKDFKISRPEGTCSRCSQSLSPGEEIVALVKAGDEELLREDYHLGCWVEPMEKQASANRDVLGVWRTKIPRKQEKKKLLIDDELLVNFFERLAGQDEQARVNLRYVLALILMRKRLLKYQGMVRRDDGTELWQVKLRGQDEPREVVDPKLDEFMISQLSASLGEIIQGDFE